MINTIKNTKTPIPERVDGIPEDAFWVGGIHGGSWYSIQHIDEEEQTVFFRIYHDTNGEIWLNQELKLHCKSDSKIEWSSLENEIIAFDGEKVLLSKSDNNGENCFFK